MVLQIARGRSAKPFWEHVVQIFGRPLKDTKRDAKDYPEGKVAMKQKYNDKDSGKGGVSRRESLAAVSEQTGTDLATSGYTKLADQECSEGNKSLGGVLRVPGERFCH